MPCLLASAHALIRVHLGSLSIAITLKGVIVSPDRINLKPILAFNLAGLLLVASWAIGPLSPLWSALDAQLFWLFNDWITPENMGWNQVLALVNTRYFDVVSLGVLGLLFTMAIRADRRTNRLFHWVAIGVVMLVVAGLVSVAINEAITYGHPSPTLYFEQATRLNLSKRLDPLSERIEPSDRVLLAGPLEQSL